MMLAVTNLNHQHSLNFMLGKQLFIILSFCFGTLLLQCMVVTRSGPPGINVVGHVTEELSTSFVTATILDQHTEDKTAGDRDHILNQKGVTHRSVQVKFYESN